MSAPARVANSELTVHIDNLIDALRSPQTRLQTARHWGGCSPRRSPQGTGCWSPGTVAVRPKPST